MKNGKIKIEHADDYTHSANSLFHFMNRLEYLKQILVSRAIFPRYCTEEISYLGISVESEKYERIAVMQKCFCDIPLSKITTPCFIKGSGEVFDGLTQDEKDFVGKQTSHTDFYGEYGIAFSKSWGEENQLQPVQYLNHASSYFSSFKNAFNKIVKLDDVADEIVDDILDRLAFVKPLRGRMSREITFKNNEKKSIFLEKNFHDEKEWRYVPDAQKLAELKIDAIIANPNILSEDTSIINDNIATDSYSNIWLRYNYDKIRYIIVPDSVARIEVIDIISNIHDSMFDIRDSMSDDSVTIDTQKKVIISKILVLKEIRRDL